MEDFPLTSEELRRLFDAVYERDMAVLRKQVEEARSAVERAQATLNASSGPYKSHT